MADKIMDFLNRTAQGLESKQVKAGFIDGSTYPDGTPVAGVAAENEYGVPEKHQPPRPYFRNSISEHQADWEDTIARGTRAGIPVSDLLEVVGAQIQGDVQESISQLMNPPLSEFTIATRKERGNDSTKPLVDTKVMIGDVNYEVSDIEPSQSE